ncbi:hypothetical protein ACH3VR_12915 [Microbacterium sp. B2969]|uniref:Carboxypeptidase regulatory-like domain-containing protein n=1 Tax=Microbacterium alkaliflavum TaxID=3248839 RepID=A0ABW7Q981_9MICO
MVADTIQTSVGPVPVLHRLALGVVLKDAMTDRIAVGPLRVGWEAEGHLLPRRSLPGWPCVDFEPVGTGRFRLRVTPRRPALITVRIDDPSRRYVPRRLTIPLWTHDELTDPSPANQIAVRSRTVQVWLWPGAAYPFSSGTTFLRARVARLGRGVPWSRIVAISSIGTVLGRAHGDDRGEFVLPLADTAQNPLQSSVTVRLLVRGPNGPAELPPPEVVARPANPPVPGDLDNSVLRGLAPPSSLVPSIPPPPLFTVPVGQAYHPASDITFVP